MAFQGIFNFLKRAPAGDTSELGTSGLSHVSGFVREEFHKALQGARGRQVYIEMRDNDATVGAFLFAVEMLLRAVDWRMEPADDSAQAQEIAEFYDGALFDDMSHTWPEFLTEVLSMLVFGWAYHEVVLKRRVGPGETDPSRRSKFTDGKIGIRKLAPRSQDTLHRWEFDEDGGLRGMVQFDPNRTQGELLIPIERALLFRTTSKKNNPEGRSILRNAYRSWYLLKVIEDSEAIGIERDLAGLPVVRVPNELLKSTDAGAQAVLAEYVRLARDLKLNQQGGVVIPSDTYVDRDGKISQVRRVDIELMSSAGQRTINTVEVRRSYQQQMMRSVLAQFLTLGADSKGSFALSSDQSDLFVRSLVAFNQAVAEPINRFLLPRMMLLNSQNLDLLPTLKPGRIAPVDLTELGDFVKALSGAGMPLFPDEGLEDYLRDAAGLPESQMDEALRMAPFDMMRAGADAAIAGAENPVGGGGGDGEDA